MCVICVLFEQDKLTKIETVAAGIEMIRTQNLSEEELEHVEDIICDNSFEFEEEYDSENSHE